MKAFAGWVGERTRWIAHTEVEDNPAVGEWSDEFGTPAEAVAWARDRTDWVLVLTDPPQWAGSPEQQPPDVPLIWQG